MSEKPLKVRVWFWDFKYRHEISKFPTECILLPTECILRGFIRKWHRPIIRYEDLKPLIKALKMNPSEVVGIMENLWNEGALIKLCPKRYRLSPAPNWKSRYRGRRYINQPRPTFDERRIIKIAGIKEKDIPNWQCALDMVGIWRYYRERFCQEPLTEIVIRDIKRQGYPEYVLKGLRVIYKVVKNQLYYRRSKKVAIPQIGGNYEKNSGCTDSALCA